MSHAKKPLVDKFPKPKLPRKRKKACIKAQGRKSYYSTIHLAKIDHEYPCKFWVNSKVINQPQLIGGTVGLIPTPTQYW